jgi:hypothetical protein
MLNLFHSVFIHDIDDLGLVRIFLGVFKHGYQSQYKSQKQEELDEIIWSRQFDSLSAGSYDTDGIADS